MIYRSIMTPKATQLKIKNCHSRSPCPN